MAAATMDTVQVDGLELAWRELGEGPAVVLVHGWPTSSFLWRDVMPAIAAAGHRVIAPDLPGFGASSKPLGAAYDLDYFDRALVGLLDAVGVERFGLAGHDLGGPVTVFTALEHPDRVERLALLNTLIYPEFSEATEAFMRACSTPEIRVKLTSRAGLTFAMRLGLATEESPLAESVIDGVAGPFESDEAQRALAEAGIGADRADFAALAARLGELAMPVHLLYGERDRILPDNAETMARLRADIPHATQETLPGCGHFLQEEEPQEVGRRLARFFSGE